MIQLFMERCIRLESRWVGGYIRFAMMVLAVMPDKVARRAPGRVYLVFWTLAAM